MDEHAHRVASPPVLTTSTLVFLLATATSVLAQQQPSRAPADKTNTDRVRQQDMSRREYQLRTFGDTAPAKITDPKKLKAITAQLEEDFQRVLTLHNEIVRAVNQVKPLDYGFISDSTTEIRKRASRLQSTLALQMTEAEKQSHQKPFDSNQAQLKDSLITLCEHIQRFVKNPVIETPGTVDAQQLDKARDDLETVIELSGSIKKLAERLKKSG